jgi:hypothetical protein
MRVDYRSRWQQKRRIRVTRLRLIAIGVALLAIIVVLYHVYSGPDGLQAGYRLLRPAVCWLEATENAVLVSTRSGDLFKLTPQLERVQTGWGRPFSHPAGFWGRPAVAGDRVLIGCGDVRLRAVDLATGLQAWEVQVEGSVPGVTTSGKYAYFASRRAMVHAVTAEGTVLWRTEVGGEVASAPLVTEETVVVGTLDGHVCCLDRNDGAQMWSVEVGAPVYASPRMGPSSILAGDDAGKLNSITREGEMLASLQFEGLIREPVGVREEMVICGDSSGLVMLVNPSEMSEVWRVQLDGPLAAEPILTGDAVWCGVGRRLVKLSLEDGGVLVTHEAHAETTDCIAAHGRIYWATGDGHIRCVSVDRR